MAKPDPPFNGEPKDELAAPDDQGPSLADLTTLVFSGPLRFEDLEEAAREISDEAEESES